MKPGTFVKIRKGYENSAEELNMIFEVVEDFGDRANIRPTVWNGYLVPIECVPAESIEAIEQTDKE